MTGGIFTVIIVAILLSYGGLKFMHLIDKNNPTISEVTEKAVYDSSELMNLNEEGFRFAFSFEGYLDEERKDNPAYVKNLVRLTGLKNGEKYERIIPYHECEESDLQEFAPPTKGASDFLDRIISNPKRGLFCVDWDDDNPFVLQGNENNFSFATIDILLLPCNYVHSDYGDIGDFVHKDCIANKRAQEEYLGNINAIIYHTT